MRHLFPARAAFAFALLSTLPACSKKDPLYCDNGTPCADPERPFCDDNGAYPASDGIKHTCIPYPWDASTGPDAGPPCTPGEWVLDTIVDGGDSPALAVDRSGAVHVVYAAGDPSVLHYARGGAGSWIVDETPESGGFYPQIAIDSEDGIHIVHGGWPAGLRYLHKRVSDDEFEYELVANPLAFDIGFALDTSERPVTCFLDSDAAGPPECHQQTADGWEAIEPPETGTKTGISIAIDSSDTLHLTADGLVYFSRSGGTWSAEETINNITALYTPLAVDSDGVPHVAYEGNGEIVHSFRSGSGDWNEDEIENVVEGQSPSLFIDGNDVLHVAYVDVSNSNLKYARGDGDSWDRRTIDATATIPAQPRIIADANGTPHVVYVDVNDGDLRYAYLCP